MHLNRGDRVTVTGSEDSLLGIGVGADVIEHVIGRDGLVETVDAFDDFLPYKVRMLDDPSLLVWLKAEHLTLVRKASWPRRFCLRRASGVLGYGVQWPGGAVAIRWCGSAPSTVHWNSIEDARTVLNRRGPMNFEWLDSAEGA
jgi:hypothetical protein